jgi:uncharacterized protein YggE
MRKLFLVLTLITTMVHAQEVKQIPQISVSGEGKIKVIPDEATITVAVENSGKDATEVKKLNDATVEKVLKAIKQAGIAPTDFQSQRVNLNKNYDYNTKKYSYVANQTISIHLKDLTKYDKLMMDLVDSGINNIQGVAFASSKIKEFERQARKEAMLNAKEKATDYVSVLAGQKVGKAILISDNSSTNYPRPPMYAMKSMAMADSDSMPRETLAIGEIEIIATVNVSFTLE